MMDAVIIVNNHLKKVPDDVRTRLAYQLFRFFRQMDDFSEMWRPSSQSLVT